MNDVQTNQLGRAQKDAQFLTDHAANLTATPEIAATLLPELQAAIQKVLDDDALATQDNTGNAAGKSDVRLALEESVFHVAMGLVSYADDQDDFVMQNMFDFTISDIEHFRDSRLQQYAQSVHTAASGAAVAAALAADHNVSAADITDLNTDIGDFSDVIATPLEKRAESVAYGKLVDRDLVAVNQVLDKVRRKMRTYRKTNRLLFDMFTATDTIDDFGHGKTGSTISGSVGVGETKQVVLITYDAAAGITMQNTGVVLLDFSLYLAGTAQGTPISVAAGTTVTTTMGALATDGNELRVHNGAATAGTFKVTI